jgi:hypothetical protein
MAQPPGRTRSVASQSPSQAGWNVQSRTPDRPTQAWDKQRARDQQALGRAELDKRRQDFAAQLKQAAQALRERARQQRQELARRTRLATVELKRQQRLALEAERRQQAIRDQQRARAAAQVEAQQKAEREAQGRRQAEEAKARQDIRSHEIKSFSGLRDHAEALYLGGLLQLAERERNAMDELRTQQRSLGGMMARLVKGGGHHERQAEELRQRFEAERLQRHLTFETQSRAREESEQKARLRYAADHKAMVEMQQQERERLQAVQDRQRDSRIDDRLQTLQQAQTREQEREPQSLTASFAAAASHDGQPKAEPQTLTPAFPATLTQEFTHSR